MARLFRISGCVFLLFAAGILVYGLCVYALFFIRYPEGAITVLPLLFGGIVSIALGAVGWVLLAVGRGKPVMPVASFKPGPRR